MKIYLVGGAVRDKLLGLPVKEKDWVVVGATPEEMLKLGYRSVGKDFPVFLHPETQEEYALARTERKVGRGYTGFEFNTSPHVTLKEDLMRRDLTINAMAEDENRGLIDFYGGQADLENKLLRHVSLAFTEDPVRILRVARFAARYPEFSVAPETMALMKKMVESGEVNALVPERVWKELEKGLGESNPEKFFEVLRECGAMKVLFPEITDRGINAVRGINASKLKNRKISPEERLQRPIFQGNQRENSSQEIKQVHFANLLNDLSLEEIKKICDRYRVPTSYQELALMRIPSENVQIASEYDPLVNKILTLFLFTDAFRRNERFEMFLRTNEAKKFLNENDLGRDQIMNCFEQARKIDTKELLDAGFTGKELGEQVKLRRAKKIAEVLFPRQEAEGKSASW